jgi:hypothetical protein
MAGSYRHCCNEDGSFGFDLIENLGDAHEACDMMFWMINYLAKDHEKIKEAEEAYYEDFRRNPRW